MTATWRVDGLTVPQGDFSLGPVDLSLAPGETVAVIGRSGSGKTTLLRAIAGFLPTSAGRIRRDDDDVGASPPEARNAVYVPAGLGLFPDRTVRANLAFPGRVRGEDDPAAVRAAAERFGVVDLLERYPRTLSEGQRERVAVARATLARPSLLLWDEPLGALDVESRRDLLEALGELRGTARFPVLLVTHDAALGFSLADRFLVLEHGAPTFSGTAEELVATPTDPFVARFVGYENVLEASALVAHAASSGFARTLRGHAGPSGVAAPPFEALAGDGGEFRATVERVVPDPEGPRLVGACDGLPVVLVWNGHGPAPRAGDPVGFGVDPGRLHALAASPRAVPA
jgi:ABC-type Fe3+/spermidine/putrescine transport system ATPase subunit